MINVYKCVIANLQNDRRAKNSNSSEQVGSSAVSNVHINNINSQKNLEGIHYACVSVVEYFELLDDAMVAKHVEENNKCNVVLESAMAALNQEAVVNDKFFSLLDDAMTALHVEEVISCRVRYGCTPSGGGRAAPSHGCRSLQANVR